MPEILFQVFTNKQAGRIMRAKAAIACNMQALDSEIVKGTKGD
jgi:hypothetical protein